MTWYRFVARFGMFAATLIEQSHASLPQNIIDLHTSFAIDARKTISDAQLQYREARKRALAAIKMAKQFRDDTGLSLVSCSNTFFRR